jgi:hypothetical protein
MKDLIEKIYIEIESSIKIEIGEIRKENIEKAILNVSNLGKILKNLNKYKVKVDLETINAQ